MSPKLLAPLLCLAIGCGQVPPQKGAPAGLKGAQPSTPQEKAVAAYILEKAHEPGSVVFAKWESKPELVAHDKNDPKWKGVTVDGAIQVSWREKNAAGAMQLYERVFFLAGATIL